MAVAAGPGLRHFIATVGLFIIGLVLAVVGGGLLVLMIRDAAGPFHERPIQFGAYLVMLTVGVVLIVVSFTL